MRTEWLGAATPSCSPGSSRFRCPGIIRDTRADGEYRFHWSVIPPEEGLPIDIRPGKILWEVQEAYQPAIVKEKLSRGPLEYAALWQIAQRLSDRPVKFGAICAPALASMLWNEHYPDHRAMVLDLCDIMNAELRELAAAGCPLIQVEEPRHHGLTTRPDCTDAELEFQTMAFNRQLAGVDAEIWVHTCWGNPNQQRVYWEVPSYERALPHLLQLNCDVLTFECASSDGRDLPLFAK